MYLVFSDAHGCKEQVEQLLLQWDPQKETLVYLGDMVDRGPDTLGVIRLLMKAKEAYPERVVILQGNHDEDFVYWLGTGDEAAFYMTEDIKTTVKSFYQENPKKYKKDTKNQKAQYINRNFRKEVQFLRNLPLYHETEHCIFVHAGIDLSIPDWKESSVNHFIYYRKRFYFNAAVAPKRVFFGHTPVSLICKDRENPHDVWISTQGDKVGIDGGCCFEGGQLNGVRVNERGEIVEEIHIAGPIPEKDCKEKIKK